MLGPTSIRLATREDERRTGGVGTNQIAVVPVWSPNRLRHNRATELRPYGLDLTKTVLGHTKVETTQVYAERDIRAAKELVARIG